MIRILLADDHVMVREGTRRILEKEPDLQVVAEASDGAEAVKMALREQPDIVVIDISMPIKNGIEATKEIKQILPNTAVLVLTAYDDDEYVFAILEAGAAGYLLKNARGSEVIDAVRRVYEGESVLHPSIA
ncbi:MAG: response regulator transcription factor, partial [Chloroflexi bacterium]|nr:response regulator transcription factor [Chloroflexota bacterium]